MALRRAHLGDLGDLAQKIAPVAPAGSRRLEVPGQVGALVGGWVPRGGVVTVRGAPGAGATSAALALVAAATAAGEWAAFVDPGSGSLGGIAAAEAGVALARCAVVRGVGQQQWTTVVGALLDGLVVVVAAVPPRLTIGDARRLHARARERQSVLVALESVPGVCTGTWPADATRRIEMEGAAWRGLEPGTGLLDDRVLHAHVTGKGAAPRQARIVA